MEIYTAICKVNWWFDYELRTEYRAITNVRSFASAVNILEAQYMDDLDSFEIKLIEEETCPLTETLYHKLWGGDY